MLAGRSETMLHEVVILVCCIVVTGELPKKKTRRPTNAVNYINGNKLTESRQIKACRRNTLKICVQ